MASLVDERLIASNFFLLTISIIFALAVAGGLSFAAWMTGLMLYADGGWFTFIVGTGDAWALDFHIIPARSAVYLLTTLPAETAHELGLPAQAAMRLYQALFLSIPFFGIAACLVLIPRGLRWLLLFPAISALALVISALGFPTETVLTLSAFWPALFGYRYADGRAGSAVLTLFCTLLFVFSHPGMMSAPPLLPVA